MIVEYSDYNPTTINSTGITIKLQVGCMRKYIPTYHKQLKRLSEKFALELFHDNRVGIDCSFDILSFEDNVFFVDKLFVDKE